MTPLDIGVVGQKLVRNDGEGRAGLELLRELADRGHRLTVYAHSLEPDLIERVRFRRLRRVPGPQLADDLGLFARATLMTRRGGHQVTWLLGPSALPPAPFVFYAHFSHNAWRRTWTRHSRPPIRHRLHALVAGRIENLVARRANTIISTTESLAGDLGDGSLDRTVVAPPGIDLGEHRPATSAERHTARQRYGLGSSDLTVVFLGGYATGRKGLEPLVDAVALGQEHLLIAGNGDSRSIVDRARARGAEARVHTLGFVPAGDVLAAADVVAVPSLYEPFSLVGLEAAQRAIPIVVSASAGVARHLGDAAVEIRDPSDPRSIRSALDLLASPSERARRGQAGRVATAALAWSAVVGRAADAVERAARG